jgi:hypothetical protein
MTRVGGVEFSVDSLSGDGARVEAGGEILSPGAATEVMARFHANGLPAKPRC